MRLPTLTGEFRTGGDPELRFTPSGKAVCSVSLIATESKNTGTRDNPNWEDGDSTPWITVTLWDQAAEEMAATIVKGERVLVTGQLYVRTYDRREGGQGQSIELKYAVVAPIPGGKPKGVRSTTRDERDPWTTMEPGGRAHPNVPDDPWATPNVPQQRQQNPWGGQPDDSPF